MQDQAIKDYPRPSAEPTSSSATQLHKDSTLSHSDSKSPTQDLINAINMAYERYDHQVLDKLTNRIYECAFTDIVKKYKFRFRFEEKTLLIDAFQSKAFFETVITLELKQRKKDPSPQSRTTYHGIATLFLILTETLDLFKKKVIAMIKSIQPGKTITITQAYQLGKIISKLDKLKTVVLIKRDEEFCQQITAINTLLNATPEKVTDKILSRDNLTSLSIGLFNSSRTFLGYAKDRGSWISREKIIYGCAYYRCTDITDPNDSKQIENLIQLEPTPSKKALEKLGPYSLLLHAYYYHSLAVELSYQHPTANSAMIKCYDKAMYFALLSTSLILKHPTLYPDIIIPTNSQVSSCALFTTRNSDSINTALDQYTSFYYEIMQINGRTLSETNEKYLELSTTAELTANSLSPTIKR